VPKQKILGCSRFSARLAVGMEPASNVKTWGFVNKGPIGTGGVLSAEAGKLGVYKIQWKTNEIGLGDAQHDCAPSAKASTIGLWHVFRIAPSNPVFSARTGDRVRHRMFRRRPVEADMARPLAIVRLPM
jgi:hypothetical protein